MSLPARRPIMAALVLLLVYSTLSLFVDHNGFFGTDTGAKVATLDIMDRNGTTVPGIGYWAERWDPTGEVHPFYQTYKLGDHWVIITTLPMLLLGLPLYALGGAGLIVLIPMLGSVFAALAARRLARQLDSDQNVAFWLVGLASPIAVYALDFWEHSLGVALMAWGVSLALDALKQQSRAFVPGVVAGSLFGLATSMRTESVVYGFVTALTVVAFLALRSSFRQAATFVGGFAVAVVALVAANVGLERAVAGASIRFDRSTSAATAAVESGGDVVATRVHEAIITAFAHTTADDAGGLFLSVTLTAILLFQPFIHLLGESASRIRVGSLVMGGLLYLTTAINGLGYVPGMIPSTPVAAVGAVSPGKGLRRALWIIAIGSLPLVWATQYTGGAIPQWGGRYILTSGLLLLVLGVAPLRQLHRAQQMFFVGAAILVSALGIGWLIDRSHGFADLADDLELKSDAAYLSREAFLLREFGPAYTPDRRWLSAINDKEELQAADVFRDAGVREFTVIQEDGDKRPAIPGWTQQPSRVVHGIFDLRLTPYVFTGP